MPEFGYKPLPEEEFGPGGSSFLDILEASGAGGPGFGLPSGPSLATLATRSGYGVPYAPASEPQVAPNFWLQMARRRWPGLGRSAWGQPMQQPPVGSMPAGPSLGESDYLAPQRLGTRGGDWQRGFSLVPRFQFGGIVQRPTMAMLGEAGPEAVVPLPPAPTAGGVPWGQRLGRAAGAAAPTGAMGVLNRFRTQFGLPALGTPPGGVGYNWGVLNEAIRRAQEGGLFGLEPPPGLLAALREQAIADAGAQAGAARLGLRGRTDIDPSTYGFQALMSDLQGQRNVAENIARANLAARMQQMQFLQQLFRQAIGGQQATQAAEAGQQGFDWGSLIGAGGTIGGAIAGRRST